MTVTSKLDLQGNRTKVTADHAMTVVSNIFKKLGCSDETSAIVTRHLIDTSLCGIESHGIMRVLQYAEQFQSGYIDPKAVPSFTKDPNGANKVDGGGGIGIPAMELAFQKCGDLARDQGIAAMSIRNVGHTGRHGSYADSAAEQGLLTILIGGGNRKNWRQVAPYGGTSGVLPTNPYCIGIPGGDQGPVVLDFATSKIAGGWVYAAKSAGALLPEGCVITKDGVPTRDPQDYFDGGAILPAGGQKGYALALVAEIIAEAMLGPSTTECNWLLITLDTGRWRSASGLQAAAEEVLDEIRTCPPAPGFSKVEVPGERERNHRKASAGEILVPEETWRQICALSKQLSS